MPQYQLTVETEPDGSDIHTILEKFEESGEAPFDESKTLELGIFLHSEVHELIGGVYGVIRGGWLFIDVLWIHENLRGQDYGTRLLKAIEQESVARGVNRVFLGTADYQARPFYEKQGYSILATAQGNGLGRTSWLMFKENIAPEQNAPEFNIETPPNPEYVHQLDRRLKSFNRQHVPDMPSGFIFASLRDETGMLLGGIVAGLSAYAMVFHGIWVDDSLRGQNYEARLMEMVEHAAVEKQCGQGLANATNEHTIQFLRQQGYEIKATHIDYPEGYNTYLMQKPFDS